jgi:hypothetical protein
LLGVLIFLAAAPSGASMPLLETVAEFSACFVSAEERRGRAWAYMPGKNGGTFTDFGARGAPATYWLQVRAANAGTHARLLAAGSSPVAESVEQCR